jgi:ribose transport system substrate-binding protein
VVKEAISFVESHTGVQSTWFGPASGPKPQSGVHAVYIPTDAKNALSLNWGQDLIAAGQKIGWVVTMIDGAGTAQGWTTAMTQAIALKPQVIITSADAPTLAPLIKEANGLGIKVIGLHATTGMGPDLGTGVFDNISSDPTEGGKAQAYYAIADSCGTAKVIIEWDSSYQIATTKAVAMKATIESCKGCQVLAYVDSPMSELSSREPQLCTNWATKYGKGWYGLSNYDGIWDYCVPSLQAAGFGPSDVKLIACDGTAQAYQRMNTGQYQVATAPEPAEMQAYIALDEAIRAVAGGAPSYGVTWTQPVFLAFKEAGHGSDLNIEGGDKSQFFPSNDYVNNYLKLWGVQQ